MEYSFNCYGHKNITAKHKTTLEFTKDKDMSLKGDCIIGAGADFKLSEIKQFIKSSNNKNIAITMQTMSKNKKIQDKIIAEINPGFSSNKEMVIRKTDFISERTFAIKASKVAFELDRDLIGFLKEEKSKIKVIIKGYSS
ncbi:DUF371 domain-containing protein [Candidatus Woesearchaeota archaeon]|nr:DUF371 domain-containing protein [Candidatus Woesearchaeota archaeon]